MKKASIALCLAAGLLSGLIGAVLTPQHTLLAVILAMGIYCLCFGWYKLGQYAESQRQLDWLRDEAHVARREFDNLMGQLEEIRKDI